MNATASSVGEPLVLREGIEIMRRAQAELDELQAPTAFREFVDADRLRRTDRIHLHQMLADAHERHDAGQVSRLGRELVQGNVVPSEQAEDHYFLTHCP